MGLFDFLKAADINQGLQQYRDTPGALLIDVREADEYAQGRVPGSVNVPLSRLEDDIGDVAENLDRPLFVYCLGGSRSARAVAARTLMGFEAVTKIGGIRSYRGVGERG